MQVVSGLLTGLVAFVATVAMLALLAATSRRVMGAPVGWIRAGVVSLLSLTAGSAALTYGLRTAGWSTLDGRLTVAPLVALAAIALTFAWTFVLGLCVLLVLELLVPTGAVPSPWRAVRGLRQGRRETRRYAQILTIGVRHGLGGALSRGARQPDGSRLSRTDERRLATGLRDALSDAGVTFVKFGQVLSTRRDLLTPTFADTLATLQSDVAPAPWPQVEAALEAALGRPVGEVFAELSPEPLASASVGQVHAARLPDGRRPAIRTLSAWCGLHRNRPRLSPNPNGGRCAAANPRSRNRVAASANPSSPARSDGSSISQASSASAAESAAGSPLPSSRICCQRANRPAAS